MFSTWVGRSLVICLLTTIVDPAKATSQCPERGAPLTEFGQHYALPHQLSAPQPRKFLRLALPGTDVRYVRILVKPSAVTPGWRLIIRDRWHRALQVIDERNFIGGAPAVWSERLPTSSLDLSLLLDRELPGFFIDIPAANAMPEKAEKPYYSIKGFTPDWEELFSDNLNLVPPKVRLWGESVGMLTTFTGAAQTGYTTWCCSGTVIATEPEILFLTNFHCGGLTKWPDSQYWSQDICDNTIIDMSWDSDAVSMEYACKRVVKSDARLDAAVLEIVPMMLGASPAKPVRIQTSPVDAGENLLIIHHPQCLTKRVSQGCVVGASLPNWRDSTLTTEFAHRCDSEGGSSGAPVFDDAGNLVGLHHLGYELQANDQCDNVNKAVSSAPLYDFLKTLPITTIGPPN